MKEVKSCKTGLSGDKEIHMMNTVLYNLEEKHERSSFRLFGSAIKDKEPFIVFPWDDY